MWPWQNAVAKSHPRTAKGAAGRSVGRTWSAVKKGCMRCLRGFIFRPGKGARAAAYFGCFLGRIGSQLGALSAFFRLLNAHLAVHKNKRAQRSSKPRDGC